MKLISSKIEKLRKIKFRTQEEFCKKVGFTVQTYGDSLKKNRFNSIYLGKMADVLGVSVSYFFDEDINTYNNNVNDINIVNDNKSGYGSDSDLKKENAALKKEIKYLKEINELLKNKNLK